MKILFLVQDLATGGVIRQIATQAEPLEQRGHTVSLLGLSEFDAGWKLLWDESARPVKTLLRRPPRRAFPDAFHLIRATRSLRKEVRTQQIDVLYAYQGNLARFLAWLATRRSGSTLVWGLRGAGLSYGLRKGWKLAVPFLLARVVSASVPLLIANSEAAGKRRRAAGFRCRRQLTIPNGFDTEAFRPDASARARIRAEWGIGDEPLVGIAGRLAWSKDPLTFLEAAAALARRRPDVRYVVVGDGPLAYKQELEHLSRELGLDARLRWAGLRGDMPAVFNAVDILCSASQWEGFANVIGEAMACGVPCVVTDTGDSAVLVADGGIVVPLGDSDALANALETMLERLPDVQPLEIRRLITSRFSIERCVDATEAALIEARAAER